KNLDAKKEAIYLVQDQEKYGAAANQWDALIKQLMPNINQPGMKEQYFECYFNLTFCVVKSTPKAKDDATKARLFKQAGNLIVSLEKQYPDDGGEEWHSRYLDLLDTTPELKKEYDALKAAAPK